MTKNSRAKPTSEAKQNKKKATKSDLQKLGIEPQSEDIPKPTRKLRKLNRKQSSDEDFISDNSQQEDLLDQDYNDVEQPQEKFDRFRRQDDEDIRKEKEQQENKKNKKKPKNNQEIDKAFQNIKNQDKKPAIKKKQEPRTQLNIADMFKMQKLKKQQRARSPSPQPQISDDIQNSLEPISDDALRQKKIKSQHDYYKEYQGNQDSNLNEHQLIQRAKKMSLQSAKKEIPMDEEKVNLDDFQFENLNPSKQPNIFKKENDKKKDQNKPKPSKNQTKISYSKDISREISQQKYEDKKPKSKSVAKKKATKKQREPKQGALGDEVICFTGQFQPYTKDEIIELCQKLGGQTPKSLTKAATVLLQGAFVVDNWKRRMPQDMNTTGKSKEAKQRGIRIVANPNIDDFFIQKTGKSLEEHFRKNPAKIDGFVTKQKHDGADVQIDIDINPEMIQQNQRQKGFCNLWTQKYKPNNLDEVIGQSSQIKQLRQWLKDWQDVVLRGNKKDAIPTRGFLPSGTINSRAALLSGDPGLGKTTTARLLAQQLNYRVSQFNASDIRNKKGVQLLQTNSLGMHQSAVLMNTLIIMDQVDGMSKGDRGGISEIINIIKTTTVPIICICNDRQSQKIRSLAGHCLDIKFHKPDKRLIIKRLQEIVSKEGGKASELVLTRIVQTFQNDMRQILTYLQLLFKTKANQLQAKDIANTMNFAKDNSVLLTHFDATKKLLNRPQNNAMPLRQKLDCFFIDSDLVPIMVHENYLASMKKGKLSRQEFHKLVKAADGFVLADLIDTRIRKQQDWGLMPAFGFMSCVYPSEMVAESLGFPQFPSWLGKFSSERKHKRLLKQLRQTIHCQTPSTLKSIRYGRAQILYQEINYLLKNDKVQQTLDLMQTYGLSPTSLNQVLLQCQYNPQKNILLPDVTTSTKTKLTKAYNRRHEQNKMKGKVKKVATKAPQHQKFNQVLQQMSDDDFINDQEDENKDQNSEMIDQENGKKAAKKGGKGVGKKK